MFEITLEPKELKKYYENEEKNCHTENLIMIALKTPSRLMIEKAFELKSLTKKSDDYEKNYSQIHELRTFIYENVKILNYGEKIC